MRSRKRKPVFVEVADHIRAAILEWKLQPGSKVPQDKLAAELGVSRLPIRQALLVLQREGLVYLDHGRGAIVAPVDIKFISDVFDCRILVEGYITGELATRADFDVSELREIVREGLEAAERGENKQDLVARFHVVLYEAVGNRVISGMMEPLIDHVLRVMSFVQARRGVVHPDRPSQLNTWTEHAEIVDAIERHDAAQASTLARTHVERIKQKTIAFLVASTAEPKSSSQSLRARQRNRFQQFSFNSTPS